MFKKLIKKIVGDPNDKMLAELQVTVEAVEDLEPKFEDMSDEQLREYVQHLRERAESGEDLDDMLHEAFALVREASKRTTGLRHYDVQIMGGTLIHERNVIEMRTGEGKTLVATLPLFLNALPGKGCHLVTVNDYLVKRDGGWMGKIFSFLGMTVGAIGPQNFSALYDPEYVNPGADLEDERLVHWRPSTRAEAYLADITYGTSAEFGFDYLRDNMVTDKANLVQRGHHCAIIDEVDNILIDESRTPLIISGPASRTGKEYTRFSEYVRRLKENTAEEDEEPNGHYDIDHKSRTVSLTELGLAEIESRIAEIDTEAGDSLYDPRFYHLTYYLDNALKAQYLFHRDKQYMVAEGQVVIIDETTGRAMPSRRYSEGLHEAIESKEGVEIQRETTTVATITIQNYFRRYEKLAGMTGTAMTDAEEFDRIYNVGVFPLPTNVQYIVDSGKQGLRERTKSDDGTKEIFWVEPDSETPVFYKRTDHPDQVYSGEESKDRAIVAEIEKYHERGRPVLVGTTSVEHSEIIGRLLKKKGIPHQVLNAKMHQSEALVVAQAGRKGAVTISTNMAGRGTDILLGGNAEGLAAGTLEDELFDRTLLTQLAKTWLTKGDEAARAQATRNSKLHPELIDGLAELKGEFDAANEKIEEVQLPIYLAQRLAGEYDVDIADARHVMSLVRLGVYNQARDYLSERDIDAALVEDATRLQNLYSSYMVASRDEDKTAAFLAEQLFDRHYQARAAVIRAVMNDEFEEAYAMTDSIPGMERSLVDAVREIRTLTEQERKEVWELGGLHVIASERHESRRIDNQLRGRAARQGDPGSSRFFLSLEDDLMKRFGGERLQNFMHRFEIPDDMPIENRVIERLISSSQERLEGYNFDIRKNLVEYDDVMSKQRETIYRERREILLSEEADLDGKVRESFDGVIDDLAHNYLDNYIPFVRGEVERTITEYSTDATDEINFRPIFVRLRGLIPNIMELNEADLDSLRPRELVERLMQLAEENYDKGVNIYQLLQSMRTFVPLVPRVPNVGGSVAGRRDRLTVRETMRRTFLDRVDDLFTGFLAPQMDTADKETIWSRANEAINEAFVRFNVEGASIEQLKTQQDTFKSRIDEALSELLMDGLRALDSDQLVEALSNHVQNQADRYRERIGEDEFRKFQRLLLLNAIDREWRDYLTAMDDLRREIQLEAFAQRDPKVMYKKRSFEMFQDMRGNINEYVAKGYFDQIERHHQFVRQQEARAAQAQIVAAGGGVAPAAAATAKPARAASGYTVVQRANGKGTEVRREQPKLGRNDQCWCGSGKKYKQCHMKEDLAKQSGRPTAAGNGQPVKRTKPKKRRR